MKHQTNSLLIISLLACTILASCSLNRTAMKGHSTNETKKFALAQQLPVDKPETNATKTNASIADVHQPLSMSKPVDKRETKFTRNSSEAKNLKIKINSTQKQEDKLSSNKHEKSTPTILPKKISMAHSYDSSGRPWILTILICFFLGLGGIHRFYLGYNLVGSVQFVLALISLFFVSVKSNLVDVTINMTVHAIPIISVIAFTILFIWVLSDFIRILMKTLKPKVGHYTT